MHPRSKHCHLIDYVIIRKSDRRDIRFTRNMCGAECWTDYRVIVAKLNLHIQPKRRPQGKKAPKRLNVNKLKRETVQKSFSETLAERLEPIAKDSQDVEVVWEAIRETVYNTAMECLGPISRKHKDRFDENCTEITQLLEEKHSAYKVHTEDPSPKPKKDTCKSLCRNAQMKLRQMHDS